ncbi:hypothetical protein Tco_1442398 [Tanacetum coccineum]
MITYLKNMEGWKHKDLKSKDFDSIKELFDKAFKRKKVDDQETTKIKELMKIVPEEEEVAIDAIPLATKPPIIYTVNAAEGVNAASEEVSTAELVLKWDQ